MKITIKKNGYVSMAKALLTLIFMVAVPVSNYAQVTWNDGVFEYSTQYVKSGKTQISLPKGEVAVKLYLNRSAAGLSDTINCSFNESDGRVSGIPDANWWNEKLKDKWNKGSSKGTTHTYNNIKYTFLGSLASSYGLAQGGTVNKIDKFFKREFLAGTTQKYSDQTDIIVPSTVEHDGVTYKVVAVQKWGFCYELYDANKMKSCDDEFYSNVNDHRNDFLESVRFEMPSNIREIGDYAFMSCRRLVSVIIPNSVEYLGVGAFECDQRLTDIRFQTVTDTSDPKYGQVRFNTLYNWTFWYCTGLKTLELPDGITTIEGQTNGGSLQYLLSLTSIRLPNTLTKIGPHFLCCAKQLEELVIPASVTSIAAASFHGCESLRNVYLLGTASSLEGGGNNAKTFGKDNMFCSDAVSNCTFWTTDDYYDSYATDATWKQVKKENNTLGNDLKVVEPETRTFEAGKWVTAIFPNGAKNYKSDPKSDGTGGFGSNARVAKLVSVRVDNNTPTLYHMTFRLIEGADIPAKLPVMICPSAAGPHVMYTNADASSVDFKKEMTKDHAVTVYADNGGAVSMKGKYIDWQLMPWDFYFKSNKFWRVSSVDNAPKIKQCRCYWTLDVNGVKEDIGEARAVMFNDEETSIEFTDDDRLRFVVDAIYDINGRKLDVPQSELPQGLFIVNGKKILVK
ncbi:MAG: leucine-rich repeat domain-containing protein [Prevotella sp.]|nr:leucine-rich repeat domain-containing protein [Prevotella sp.]